MQDYILFIDTETSNKPEKWSYPIQKTEKWPHILQISWIICDKKGDVLQARDFYIKPEKAIAISKDGYQLHGITQETLEKKGLSRKLILEALLTDIKQYQPLLVGHFLHFDLKMLEVEFFRAQMEHALLNSAKFCTMYYTRHLTRHMQKNYMRLNELHAYLTKKDVQNYHNAYADALATKACFFELIKREELHDTEFKEQEQYFLSANKSLKQTRFLRPLIVVSLVFTTLLLLYASR